MWITVVLGSVLVAAVIAYLYFGAKLELELDLAIVIGLAIVAAATAVALAIVYAPQLF